MRVITGSLIVCIILFSCSNNKIRYSNRQKFEPKEQQVSAENSLRAVLADSINEAVYIATIDSTLRELETIDIDNPIRSMINSVQALGSNTIQLKDVKNDINELNKLKKQTPSLGGNRIGVQKQYVTGIVLLCIGLVLEVLFLIILLAGGGGGSLTNSSSYGSCLGQLILIILLIAVVSLGSLAMIIVGSVYIYKSRRRFR
ncbi:MAG: hypothetical protein QNK23_15285 [Crocinitomicaceae bacterium]|nr:hypothetical protein [Crocinitomicaceae bacterium]